MIEKKRSKNRHTICDAARELTSGYTSWTRQSPRLMRRRSKLSFEGCLAPRSSFRGRNHRAQIVSRTAPRRDCCSSAGPTVECKSRDLLLAADGVYLDLWNAQLKGACNRTIRREESVSAFAKN
jgi:hypothetical protein